MRGGKVAALIYLGLMGLVSAAQAQPAFAPGIIFDMGGKFDKSFNEAAYVGAERFTKETGLAYREVDVTNEGQRDHALATMARRGVTSVVGISVQPRSPAGG